MSPLQLVYDLSVDDYAALQEPDAAAALAGWKSAEKGQWCPVRCRSRLDLALGQVRGAPKRGRPIDAGIRRPENGTTVICAASGQCDPLTRPFSRRGRDAAVGAGGAVAGWRAS